MLKFQSSEQARKYASRSPRANAAYASLMIASIGCAIASRFLCRRVAPLREQYATDFESTVAPGSRHARRRPREAIPNRTQQTAIASFQGMPAIGHHSIPPSRSFLNATLEAVVGHNSSRWAAWARQNARGLRTQAAT